VKSKPSSKPKAKPSGPFAGLKFTPIETPPFQSEREEAEWWDSHPEVVEEFMRRAAKAGAVTRGTIARAFATRPTTIRLFAEDIERAKAAAHRKGLRYQTYLKMLIHEALQREERAG